MVDYTKFRLLEEYEVEKLYQYGFLETYVNEYLAYVTKQNRPCEYVKCDYCGVVYDSKSDYFDDDKCYGQQRPPSFSTLKFKVKHPSELMTPTFSGLARFIGVTTKELRGAFSASYDSERLQKFFMTICEGDIDANLENPATSNVKGLMYSAINKHGYTENGTQEELKINFVDDLGND
jgi:hypothetical protein